MKLFAQLIKLQAPDQSPDISVKCKFAKCPSKPDHVIYPFNLHPKTQDDHSIGAEKSPSTFSDDQSPPKLRAFKSPPNLIAAMPPTSLSTVKTPTNINAVKSLTNLCAAKPSPNLFAISNIKLHSFY